MRRCLIILLGVAGAFGSGTVVIAADPGIEFFEKKVRPALVKHCYQCHAADSKKIGGNLLLDSRDGVRKGGDLGPIVESGKPDDSLLINAVRYTDESLRMPPQGKLPAAVIADLETWVKLGAPDPRDKPLQNRLATTWESILQKRRDWWSLQPVRKPEIPHVKQNAGSLEPIDRFVVRKLEEGGLSPAAPAKAATLIRRLSIVLTGLPPTAAQVDAFVKRCGGVSAPQVKGTPGQPVPREAVVELVDSLLASPRFGERWGRHWLDIVRFTETHGNEWNYEVHHAWRYRDYVIRAFNNDVPYDQFIREHIAGDLLSQPRWNKAERYNESPIGTAFYRFGEVNHDDCITLPSIGYDLADNQIDTLTKAFQATTVACARCHDHKLDAISTRDYYALLGILRSSRLVSHPLDTPDVNQAERARLASLKAKIRRELSSVWMKDASSASRYLLAAEARRSNSATAAELEKGLDASRLERWVAHLSAAKQPMEEPFQPWRLLASKTKDAGKFADTWKKLDEQYTNEERTRREFNEREFTTWTDFRQGTPADWQVKGQGLSHQPSGEIVLAPDGKTLVQQVLPAGCYTHGLSEKLTGTLRSKVLPAGKKRISFQVMGARSSAVRLVSSNCQLNYANYRALSQGEWKWVRFNIPDERESLRTYAELMTMFDNPKFPDQLSALGGDKENYKLPWDEAARNPRSYFGISRIVLHDGKDSPKEDLSHLQALWSGGAPGSLVDLATWYHATIVSAMQSWTQGKSTDADVRWLDTLLQQGLLSNSIDSNPRLQQLITQYRQTEAELAQPRITPGVGESGSDYDQPVFVRGDCNHPGEKVPRRYLEVLGDSSRPFTCPPGSSGRLELAERIASSQNPLTARVMVNRIWHHLFGSGLVRTTDDFGHVGDLPSHPELLDYLADRFMAEGWSVKRLIREIVLTRTFQSSNRSIDGNSRVDPQNRLLHHYPARRMEAEAIRDSILATSGRLDLTLYGMSIPPYRDKANSERRLFPGPLDGQGRRSVYIKNTLMEAPKFLGAFNFPGGKVTQGRRDQTNVPAQALALLNDPFVIQQSEVWAGRLLIGGETSVNARIEKMFHTALGRPPTSSELLQFEETVRVLATLHEVPIEKVLVSGPVWKDVAHSFFNLKEFIYIP